LKLLSAQRSRAGLEAFFAAAGGKNGSRYFKNRAIKFYFSAFDDK
jgi:hypothetical protein